MSDHTQSKVFIFLICFWTILTILTNVFADYLGNQALTATPLSCFKPNSNCPNINQEQDKSLLGYVNWFLSGTLNLIENIPGLNVFVPLLRVVFFQYSSNVHPLLTIFLDMTLIFTGWIVYGLVRGGG